MIQVMKRRNARQYRWTVVIVGEASGHESPVPFVQFRRFNDAKRWVEQMNAKPRHCVHFEIRPIQGGPQ